MGTWSERTGPAAPIGLARAVWHNGQLYVWGQYTNGTATAPAYPQVYDPATDSWTARNDLDTNYAGLGPSFSVGGLIYQIRAGGSFNTWVYIYDPAAGTVREVQNQSSGNGSGALTWADANGVLWVAGGSSAPSRLWSFDTATESWTDHGSISGSINAVPWADGVVGSDGRVYFLDLADGEYYPDFRAYDPSTKTVTSIPNQHANNIALNAWVAPDGLGRVVMMPHWTGSVYAALDVFDPATGNWTYDALGDGSGYVGTASTDVRYWPAYAATPTGAYAIVGGYDGSQTSVGGDPQPTLLYYDNNAAPNAPALQSLANGQTLDRAAVNRFSWTFTDPNPGDTQAGFELRYRPVGGSWATITETTPNGYWDAPAGTFTAGDHEWQVRTTDQRGATGAWSAVGLFTAADKPGAPNITAPVNGATIVEGTATVEWSTPGQDAYQVQVTEPGGSVLYDSDVVEQPATRSHLVQLPDNGSERRLRVRVRDAGLWSPWSQVSVTVNFEPPAPPLVVLSADDAAGALVVAITNPTPTGPQPPITHNDVTVDDGDTLGPLRKAAELPGNATWRYYTPVSGRDYSGHVRVTAYGDNGTSTTTVV